MDNISSVSSDKRHQLLQGFNQNVIFFLNAQSGSTRCEQSYLPEMYQMKSVFFFFCSFLPIFTIYSIINMAHIVSWERYLCF